MFKDTLYNRVNTLHRMLYKHRNHLKHLYKFHSVIEGLTPYKDINFYFYSRYGEANIIIYKENNLTHIKYYGKVEFDILIDKNTECDTIIDNRLRELELYLFKVYGIPKKYTFKEKVKYKIYYFLKSLIGMKMAQKIVWR